MHVDLGYLNEGMTKPLILVRLRLTLTLNCLVISRPGADLGRTQRHLNMHVCVCGSPRSLDRPFQLISANRNKLETQWQAQCSLYLPGKAGKGSIGR